MVEELTEVEPYKEISFKRAMPKIHEAGQGKNGYSFSSGLILNQRF